jgi:hypothetical protein
MISVGFQRVSKKRSCRIRGKPTYVASRGTKVLPSACASVRDLAGCPATVEISTNLPTIKRPISQSVPPASLEIRDAVFQELKERCLAAFNILAKHQSASTMPIQNVSVPGRIDQTAGALALLVSLPKMTADRSVAELRGCGCPGSACRSYR